MKLLPANEMYTLYDQDTKKVVCNINLEVIKNRHILLCKIKHSI